MKKMIILALVVTFSQLGLASEKVEGKGLEQMAPEQMRGHKIMVIDEQGNPVSSTPDGISDKPGRINQATNYTSSFKGDGSEELIPLPRGFEGFIISSGVGYGNHYCSISAKIAKKKGFSIETLVMIFRTETNLLMTCTVDSKTDKTIDFKIQRINKK